MELACCEIWQVNIMFRQVDLNEKFVDLSENCFYHVDMQMAVNDTNPIHNKDVEFFVN